MAEIKLKGPVGFTGRKSGDKVKNNPADVDLIRNMLIANGVKVAPGNKCDAGLIKAITTYQKKIGFKTPDQVIDPGGKTIKKLAPKYAAQQKKVEALKAVTIKYKGKEHHLSEAQYLAARNSIFKRTERYVKTLVSQHKFNLSVVKEYEESAKFSNDFMMAAAQFVIMKVGRVKYPNAALVSKSISAVAALEKAHKSKDLKAFDTTFPAAQEAVAAFDRDIQRFLNELIGKADTVIFVAKVTKAVAFGVVAAMAVPVAVGAVGPGVAAAVLAGVGAAVVESAATELGKHLAGQKVTVMQSAKAVIVDGTVGGVTAGVGSKFKIASSFTDDIAVKLAPKMASKIPGVTAKQLQPVIGRYLKGSGQALINSSASEATKVIGEMAKSGKSPTNKDFEKAAQSIIASTLIGGPMENISGFQKKVIYHNEITVKNKIIPTLTKRVISKRKSGHVLSVQQTERIFKAVEKPILKNTVERALFHTDGTQSPEQLLKSAEAQLNRDKALHKHIEKLIEAELNAMEKAK